MASRSPRARGFGFSAPPVFRIFHKNNNKYIGNQAVYQISRNGNIHKYGKADMTNLAASGNPTRLETQLNALRKLHPNDIFAGKVIYQRPQISTLNIKKVETMHVQNYYNIHKSYPPGNLKHPGIIKTP